jgi:hypothetical protein
MTNEITSCQHHVAGLMARLRDGQMTTHFGPVFAVKVPSEPSQTMANCAVTKFCAVHILYDWGKMDGVESLHGGFPTYVVNTRTPSHE